jgi:teichuronic acid biosynthesis glycosyltransferase TuaC
MRRLNERMAAGMVALDGIAHARVPTWMSACDALLLTSRHEGSPNVVKEALACNLPVVAVNVGDVAERLDGVPGCHVCSDDSPTTIAAALDERLLTRRVPDVYRSVLGAPPAGG